MITPRYHASFSYYEFFFWIYTLHGNKWEQAFEPLIDMPLNIQQVDDFAYGSACADGWGIYIETVYTGSTPFASFLGQAVGRTQESSLGA